jgi:hypothetical protein
MSLPMTLLSSSVSITEEAIKEGEAKNLQPEKFVRSILQTPKTKPINITYDIIYMEHINVSFITHDIHTHSHKTYAHTRSGARRGM